MPRILIVNDGSILEEGIAKLLSARKELAVMSVGFESEMMLQYHIASFQPDVLIMDRSMAHDPGHYLALLGQEVDHTQIMLVGVDSNMITVYENARSFEVEIHNLADLLMYVTV